MKGFSRIADPELGRKSKALYRKSTKYWNDYSKKFQDRKAWMIYPEDQWKIIFDFLIAILTLYFCICVPYRIGFDDRIPEAYIIIELCFDVCFFVDIALRFRCAYWKEEFLVDDLQKIAKSYLKSWFWIDFFSSIPFQLISP